MTDANWYGTVFKAWQAKQLGSKPTAEMLATVHGLGARPGKQAMAIAMGLRAEGVTGSQIVIACGAPQLNKLRGYVADALLKRVPAPPSAVGHTVYKLELTPKGAKRVAATVARDAALAEAGKAEPGEKPVKAKGKKAAVKKPRKAKAAETVTTTSHTGGEHDMGNDVAGEQPAA